MAKTKSSRRVRKNTQRNTDKKDLGINSTFICNNCSAKLMEI